mgnify:CR=1 FL=1
MEKIWLKNYPAGVPEEADLDGPSAIAISSFCFWPPERRTNG